MYLPRIEVSELADRAGIAPSAVQWYKPVGILPPPPGYSYFAEDDLTRLRLVVSLRRLGLGLEEQAPIRSMAGCGTGGGAADGFSAMGRDR